MMKITAINNQVLNYPQKTKFNFKGRIEQKDSFEKTTNSIESYPAELLQKIPKGKNIEVIIKAAQQKKYMAGSGANSVVYNIPGMSDYVLKVLNKPDPNKIDMTEFPSSVNLGQPVWQSKVNPQILILKKITGKSHSVENWSNIVGTPKNVDFAEALSFFLDIENIAKMKQKTFDDMAKKVKTLDTLWYKLDSVNPNNMIVDNKKEEINIIDYFKVKDREKPYYQNSATDITSLILDFTLFPEYFDLLSKDIDPQYIMSTVDLVDKKVQKGAQNADLSTDTGKYSTFISEIDKWFPVKNVTSENTKKEYKRQYKGRMEDFLVMLDNPYLWAEARIKQDSNQ